MEWYFGVGWLMCHGPIVGALTLGLFWAALVHPQRIRSRAEFRSSVLCLAISVMLAVAAPVTITAFLTEFRIESLSSTQRLTASAICIALSPAFLALALILGIDSVVARRAPAPPATPAGDSSAAPIAPPVPPG